VKNNLRFVLNQVKEKIENLKNPPLAPPQRGIEKVKNKIYAKILP
jgi:hypothetical protein